ncbi:MAG: CoA transferase [Acidimicrobiia bacterium]
MGFLDGYRVLDLTDERGLVAGRILADLGADVVAAEPLEGSRARRQGPFVDLGGEQRSLLWETYGANRRGVAYDPSSSDGRALVRDLALGADVVIESAGSGGDEALGLPRGETMAAAPQLVWCSISAFGLDGPKAAYADADLVVWAAGGPLEPHRDRDARERGPLRISSSQAFLHAGADAAAGILLALAVRRTTGRGQHVDVSAQASLGVATLGQVLTAVTEGERAESAAPRLDMSGSGSARGGTKWHGKDGLIEFNLAVGPAAGRFSNALLRWMADDGVDVGRFLDWDWTTIHHELTSGAVTEDDLAEVREMIRAFLASKTKLEITEAAVQRRVLPVGIFDVSDLGRSPHLDARGFWVTLGDGDRAVTMPGPFAQTDRAAFEHRRAAPSLGEHTDEIATEWRASPSPRRPAATAPGPARPPLDGLKVVDLSWVVAGPLIGRALADFGATVVRVESSRRIETARYMPPFPQGIPDPEGSALYETCNAGKLGMCLDLSTAAGQDVVRDLARWGDVVIESFSPGTMAKWGLGVDALRALNPRLVVLSTALCGQSGPWSSLAGYGNVGAALAGFQHLVGWPDRQPIGPLGPYTDYVGPRFSLAMLLAALDERSETGDGCVLDVSQVEAGIWFLAPEMAEWFATGAVAERRGNRDRAMAPHGVYACRASAGRDDGWVAIVARDDADWEVLADAMDRADLASELRFATAPGRLAAADELDAVITTWTSTLAAAEVEALLQARGVPAHRAATSEDFCGDPQLAHRGHLVTLPHPKWGEVVVEGPRYVLSETAGEVCRHAPMFHEDTDHVLGTILGYDQERIDALRAADVLV